jgi:transcriptional regulator with XRE-family HTH domain
MKAIVADQRAGVPRPAVGQLLRNWRTRRRLSQLELAVEAEISQRHLSFIESGRSQPSREMLLHVAEHLGVPLRERNLLLHAAGFAPVFRERALDDPELTAARQMIDRVLKAHEPNPALLVDRYWNLVATNSASAFLMKLVANSAVLAPPINMLRLSLHPAGFAPIIVNFAAVRAHILERLRRLIDVTADPQLTILLTELSAYPATNALSASAPADAASHADAGSVALPLRLKVGDTALSFISTITVFGSPLDITLSELALETFFPEDAATAAALAQLGGHAGAPEGTRH